MIPSRVDWFRVMTDLDRAGYSCRMVSATLGIPYSTLRNRTFDQSEPRYQDGEAIVALWVRVTGRGSDDVPRLAEIGRRVTAHDR